ncbi:MAG TPA: deaminase [Candidatus Micrarchaeia archaeon]|nr:deaminase [Candidatus Micrarchaeia archaeon]
MPEAGAARPSKQEYAVLLALAARTRADCLGRRVGAVVIREDRVLSTGYNGTPIGMPNCSEGGCHRCARRDTGPYPVGGAYDLCVCVHAEQNAILAAARFGQSTLGGTLTTTLRPCFGCCKEALQAGIVAVRYLDEWQPAAADQDRELAVQYASLRARFQVFEPLAVDRGRLLAFLASGSDGGAAAGAGAEPAGGEG